MSKKRAQNTPFDFSIAYSTVERLSLLNILPALDRAYNRHSIYHKAALYDKLCSMQASSFDDCASQVLVDI